MTPELTPAQRTTLRNDILNSTDPAVIAARGNGTDIGRDDTTLAALYNAADAAGNLLWRTDAPIADVLDSIDFTAYTPNGALDSTAAYTNRCLAAQTKQINLQLMMPPSRLTLDATKARTRSGLLDAVTNLPTGNGGAAQSAGGSGGDRTITSLTRVASRAERLLAQAAPATTGNITAYLPRPYGAISPSEIALAMNN